MARLALVSRNPGMSMGLSSTNHEIDELRNSDLDDWLHAGNDADVAALILDLGTPEAALQVVGDLRARGRTVPVLLVASSTPGWDSVELTGLSGVDLLTLPIDSARLQQATEAVLRHTPPSATLLDDVDEPPEIPEPSLLGADASVPDDPGPATPAPLPAPAPPPAPSPQRPATNGSQVLSDMVLLAAQPADPSAPTAEPPAPTAPIPVRAVDPTDTPGRARSPRRRRQAPATDVAPARPSKQPPAPADFGRSPAELVTALLGASDQLYSLTEVAEVIVQDALSCIEADAGALLVRDGDIWRVAAGTGLRNLELRYQLATDSWLVEHVGTSNKGLLILDTDIARAHLRGAPLASRHHLMAVPVTPDESMLLLARDQSPAFTEAELAPLAALAADAGPLLQQAIDVRTLARQLQHHADSTDLATS